MGVRFWSYRCCYLRVNCHRTPVHPSPRWPPRTDQLFFFYSFFPVARPISSSPPSHEPTLSATRPSAATPRRPAASPPRRQPTSPPHRRRTTAPPRRASVARSLVRPISPSTGPRRRRPVAGPPRLPLASKDHLASDDHLASHDHLPSAPSSLSRSISPPHLTVAFDFRRVLAAPILVLFICCRL